jgi:acetyl-CoA acetyltransferase
MATARQAEHRIPVIVGVGELSDHPKDLTAGLEPLALLEQALQRAAQDAGGTLLHQIDSLDIVNFLSWRYQDPAGELSARLGIEPAHAFYGPVGGESPIRFIHEAAQRIARGEASVAAICGAEAQATATKAQRAGVALPWTPFAHDVPEPKRGAAFQKPMATALGVARPITVYPFYEAATAAHWGQTPREALQESGELWARYSRVASENPNAWIKRVYPPEEIATPSPENRLIAWPYTKLMVANPNVNLGAAILVTSLSKARAAGIAEDRLVYFKGGASAEEPRDYLIRDQFFQSHAQNAVLEAALQFANGNASEFDAIELYSCFPCVPKMARRTLGLGEDVRPTVTGDGAQAARRGKVRPALWSGRICHQTSCAGAVGRATCRGNGAGQQRAGRCRLPPQRGAAFCHRSFRRWYRRDIHGDLWPRRRR